jgi:hypothetical protein
MILPDVNVLIYAHREDAPHHAVCRQWLEATLQNGDPFGMSDQVLSGFIRVATHPKIFSTPSPIRAALEFSNQIRSHAGCRQISPGLRHWQIFVDLCETIAVGGNFVPDTWYAALAIESGCEWITTDRDYARFTGLRWRNPVTGEASS